MTLGKLAIVLATLIPAVALADPPKEQLGVAVMGLTPELRAFYGAPKDSGLLVAHVDPGGYAEQAGVKVGDVITKLDGTALRDSKDLVDTWSKDQEQDKSQVAIEVVRGKGTVDLQAKLDVEPPKDAPTSV